MLKLGIVADLHGNLEKAKNISEEFKEKIDGLIILGDITGPYSPYITGKSVLMAFEDLKVPKYIIPGSHEPLRTYQAIMKEFLGFFDCTKEKNRLKELKGYDLLFLPGSDWNAPAGGFKVLKNKESLDETFEDLPKSDWKFFFIDDLKEYLKNPERTALFSHIPPKFEGKEAIDRARFAEFLFEEEQKEEVGMEIKEENVGSEGLREFIEETGIKKLVCGHIHEAGGKAQRLDGSLIEEGEYSEEIFYNVGAGTEGKAGILILKGKKAKYSKIQV